MTSRPGCVEKGGGNFQNHDLPQLMSKREPSCNCCHHHHHSLSSPQPQHGLMSPTNVTTTVVETLVHWRVRRYSLLLLPIIIIIIIGQIHLDLLDVKEISLMSSSRNRSLTVQHCQALVHDVEQNQMIWLIIIDDDMHATIFPLPPSILLLLLLEYIQRIFPKENLGFKSITHF